MVTERGFTWRRGVVVAVNCWTIVANVMLNHFFLVVWGKSTNVMQKLKQLADLMDVRKIQNLKTERNNSKFTYPCIFHELHFSDLAYKYGVRVMIEKCWRKKLGWCTGVWNAGVVRKKLEENEWLTGRWLTFSVCSCLLSEICLASTGRARASSLILPSTLLSYHVTLWRSNHVICPHVLNTCW